MHRTLAHKAAKVVNRATKLTGSEARRGGERDTVRQVIIWVLCDDTLPLMY